MFRAASGTFEVSPKYTNHFKKNWLEMDAKQNISSIRHFLKIRHWVSDVTFSQECALLTQWRFFKKCRIEDIFCFVSVFTQFFLKVIGNLWAYYKCYLGRMHHVGTWAFVQQRVFFTESPQSNLNYLRQQAFHDSKPIWADASVHYASEKYIVWHVILFSWKVLSVTRIRGNCKSKHSHPVIYQQI